MGLIREWDARGFDVIPVCDARHDCASPGKRVHITDWTTLRRTPERVERWDVMHRGNVGVRTRMFPAIDVDVEHRDVADACERIAVTTLGGTARRTRRNSARRLLLYRIEGEPFRKKLVTFKTPDGATARVEILGDGQQVVVAGKHHTGAVIEWAGGPPSAADLPAVSGARCDEVLAKLRSVLRALGCTVEGGEPEAPRPARRTWVAIDAARDYKVAAEALRWLDPDLLYDLWLTVGQALHARWPDAGGPGFTLWDAWSSRGEKYPGRAELERKWASFHAGGGITLGSLIHVARMNGARRHG